MVNKIFHIPNLKISCLQAGNLGVKSLSGLTCFIAKDSKTIYHSITDDFCKNIIRRVFEIAEILKDAGRFEEKIFYDMYPLKTFQLKKLLFSDEDYFIWANINYAYRDTLTQYVASFISDFGLPQTWTKIDKVFLITTKEEWNIYEEYSDGGFLTVDTRWGYTDKDGYYQVEPLIFILEYISRLYMHHTQKEHPYTFDIDINCKVSYLPGGHSIGFNGTGLHLLADLAYLHAVADPDQEFRQCEEEGCKTYLFADKKKNQRFCCRQHKSRFNVRQTRKRELKEKLLQKYKTVNQDWLIKQIDFLFEQGISGDKKIEKNLEELIKESGKEG